MDAFETNSNDIRKYAIKAKKKAQNNELVYVVDKHTQFQVMRWAVFPKANYSLVDNGTHPYLRDALFAILAYTTSVIHLHLS